MVSLAHPSPQPERRHNGSAILPEFTTVTDRQTDHAIRSVTIGCIYIDSTAMRPKKKMLVMCALEV